MVALEAFENLLKIQGHMNSELSDRDYGDMREFIYQTIKNTVMDIA